VTISNTVKCQRKCAQVNKIPSIMCLRDSPRSVSALKYAVINNDVTLLDWALLSFNSQITCSKTNQRMLLQN